MCNTILFYMKFNKLFLFITILILLCFSVFSLSIVYPNFDYISQYSNTTFNFQVFDSNNYLLDNSTTNCFFSLSEFNGNLLYSKQLDYNNNFFIVTLDGNNFTKLQTVYYNINCNSSTDAGYLSKDVLITKNGNKNDVASILGFFGIFIALIFFAWVMKFTYEQLDKKYGVKLFLLVIMLMIGLLTIFASISFLNGKDMISGMDNFTLNVTIIIGIFVVSGLTYAVIMFIRMLAKFFGWKD